MRQYQRLAGRTEARPGRRGYARVIGVACQTCIHSVSKIRCGMGASETFTLW
ncbi:MAG: hypothetical protein ACI31D_10270 [Candidatus Limisoma sp.]